MADHSLLLLGVIFGIIFHHCGCVHVSQESIMIPLQNKTKPYIIDLTMFNGDPMGLYRLHYLYDVVDKFVIVECKETFQGNTKEKYFIDRQQEKEIEEEKETKEKKGIINRLILANKLRIIRIDHIPMERFKATKTKTIKREQAWYREIYGRNIGLRYVYEVAHEAGVYNDGNYILIHGDADEIPRKELLLAMKNNQTVYDLIDKGKGIRLEMSQFLYNFKFHTPPNDGIILSHLLQKNIMDSDNNVSITVRVREKKERVLRQLKKILLEMVHNLDGHIHLLLQVKV